MDIYMPYEIPVSLFISCLVAYNQLAGLPGSEIVESGRHGIGRSRNLGQAT